MTNKNNNKIAAAELVIENKLSYRKAAEVLKMSTSHIQKLVKKYRHGGRKAVTGNDADLILIEALEHNLDAHVDAHIDIIAELHGRIYDLEGTLKYNQAKNKQLREEAADKDLLITKLGRDLVAMTEDRDAYKASNEINKANLDTYKSMRVVVEGPPCLGKTFISKFKIKARKAFAIGELAIVTAAMGVIGALGFCAYEKVMTAVAQHQEAAKSDVRDEYNKKVVNDLLGKEEETK